MKPIHLSLSGLQSYREKQEIDFVRLCEAGVFGIFGPTGSGKSTVLDAVTLALYGKVGRADKGTQGIINQSENVLAVSFTFELTGAGGRERYRVDRQFKRSGELSVQNTLSRLVRLHADEAEVLADKMGDVSARIEEIIGLSMSDFTRAVVLPQGKFAEFLSLTGKDRRQMLQRLFRLEPYGDRLLAKLSAQSKATETELKEVHAEQQGLGDASAEALQRADDEFKQGEAEVLRTRGLLTEREKHYETGKRIWQWQSEKNETEAELASLASCEADIRAMELGLEKTHTAEIMLPLLREKEAAVSALEQKSELLREAEEFDVQAVKGMDKSREKYAAAQVTLRQNEPVLTVRVAELEQSIALEEEISRLAEQHRERSSTAEALSLQLKTGQERWIKEQELYERAQNKQAELKRQLAISEIKFEERQKIQSAIRDKQQLDWLTAQAEQYAADSKEKVQQLAASERHLNELNEKNRLHKPIFMNACSQNLLLRSRLRHLEDGISVLTDELSEFVMTMKREEKQQEMSRLASLLAERLTVGEPCPVCGSLHHPDPTVPVEQTSETISNSFRDAVQTDALQMGETLIQRARELHYRYRQLLEKAESWAQSAVDYEVAEEEGKFPYTEQIAAASTLTVEVDSTKDTIESRLFAYEKFCLDAEAALEECHAIFSETETQLRQYVQSLEKDKATMNEAIAQHQAVASLLEEVRCKQSRLLSELSAAMDSWKENYPNLSPEQTESERKRLEDMDRLAEELRSRLQTSETFLQEKRINIQQLLRDNTDKEKAQLQDEAQLHALGEVLNEKQRELRNKTGDQRAETLLQEVRSRLDQLRGEEKSAQIELDEAVSRQQKSTQQLLMARQGKDFAADTANKAERAWTAALLHSSFADEGEVRQSLLDDMQKREWVETVNNHREKERDLTLRIQQLVEKLADQTLSVEEWEALMTAVKEAKEQYETALQNQARAARDLEDLRQRHLRYQELENRRTELSARFDRLLKLQSIFRGNAFVEFLAEEQLMQVCRAASERLGFLTRRRYALEVDSGGGFVIRDDANGGMRRPVSTLSGGETFLASLALALALSAQIQLKGIYPLEFFFLDEGFGTLDAELLETVVTALERLHADRLCVGVISHVPELRARLPRRLIVHSAEPSGRGSRVEIETF